VKAEELCAQHLAGKRRREKNDAERRARDEALREERVAMESWVNRLATHGIAAVVESTYANISGWGKPTGRVLVDPAEVLSALSAEAKSSDE
jgi:hypothetical protein